MAKSVKQWLVIGILALGVVTGFTPDSVEAAIVRRPPNNLGLKGYWSFNEGAGTVATNFASSTAGAANTGTLTNMEAADWVSGKMSKALSFDGVDEYVSVPDSSSLDLTTAMTISAWVYLTEAPDATHGAGVVVKGTATDGNAGSYELTLLSDLGVYGRIYTNAAVSAQTAANLIPLNTWHHVVATYNKTSLIVYVDGVSKATTAQTNNLEANNGILAIGTRPAQLTGAAFPGKIDEVRVYNTALTAAQVLALYQSGVTTLAAPQNNSVTNGLIGLWTFDGRDTSNGGFLDRSSAGTHPAYMSLTMSTSTAYAPGRIGQGMKFDGVDDYMQVPNSADFDFGSNNFTISWWEYRTGNDNGSISINRRIAVGDFSPFLLGYSNGGADLLIYMSSALGSWDVANGEILGPVALNEWVHYIVKRSGTTFTTYANGVQTNTWESALALANAGGTDPDYDLTFGSYQNIYFFKGTLDDVRIYNRAVTTAEISQMYASGRGAVSKVNTPKNTYLTSGLVGLWSFDGPDMVAGSTAYDRSGSGYDGTLTALTAASAVPGKVGQALYFDGNADEITIPNLDAYATRSVAFWLKRGRDPANWFDGIIACSTTGGWGIGIYDYGGAGSKIYDGNIGATSYVSTAGITDREWHHVVETRGGGTLKFYIDGVLDSSQADSDTYDCASGTATYQIGNINSTSPKFQGVIDDLRLYNRVLTATEVSALYNRTK